MELNQEIFYHLIYLQETDLFSWFLPQGFQHFLMIHFPQNQDSFLIFFSPSDSATSYFFRLLQDRDPSHSFDHLRSIAQPYYDLLACHHLQDDPYQPLEDENF
ncbi:hypothetical protein HanIR_Chr10g0465461 [Helianthus annuus]|nr:hypothetical protein HanIR_Chr10g0465461 [Helianthus annuus]